MTALWGALIRAMTGFTLLESWLWLTTSLICQRQTQARAVPRAPERLLPTAPQEDRPVPARAVPQVQDVWQHQGTPVPALLLQGVPRAEVFPAPPRMPAMGQMALFLTPGSGQSAELGAPWQETLWTRVAKSTIHHWLVQQIPSALGLAVWNMLAAGTWSFSPAWRIANPTKVVFWLMSFNEHGYDSFQLPKFFPTSISGVKEEPNSFNGTPPPIDFSSKVLKLCLHDFSSILKV